MSVAQVKLRLPLLSLLILQLILANIRMAENEKDDFDNGGVKKRIPKCSGCKVKFDDHGWGQPGPYCEGYHTGAGKKGEITLSDAEALNRHVQAIKTLTDSEHEDEQASDDELALIEELRSLDMKEERLKREKNDRIVRLQELIEKKRRSVETLEESLTRMPHPDQFSESFDEPVRSEPVRATNTGVRMTTKDLRRLTLKEELPQTPIDELLVDLNMDDDGRNVRFAAAGSYKEHNWKRNKIDIPSLIEAHQLNKDRRKIESSSRLFKNLPDPADVFLAPIETAGEIKALRIIDFVNDIIPHEDERMIGNDAGGSTRLLVKYGKRKPKLESVTVAQWTVANTRIMHRLISSKQLVSYDDIKSYLAYTVKVMQLCTRYTWVSILRFDDEFRQLQAFYQVPWTYDSNHLHIVHLVPRKMTNFGNASFNVGFPESNNTVLTTSDGRTICKRFNTKVGCAMVWCKFAHVCCRRLDGGRACELQHPCWQHNFFISRANPRVLPPTSAPSPSQSFQGPQ